MISIKQFLDSRTNASRQGNGPREGSDLVQASLQMVRLLIEAVPAHTVRGCDADYKAFGRAFEGLLRKLNEPPSAMNLLGIASEAAEAMEDYAQRTAGYLREQNCQMQSIVAMLTDTLADVSGQADSSVARLQAIEQQIERASGLDDMRALSASLEGCLASIRDAAAHQRDRSTATVQRLREQISVAQKQMGPERSYPPLTREEIDLIPEPPETASESVNNAYVAAFKLQRAEHIAIRFGENAKSQMLALISRSLKAVLGPNDRLLRWKGTSFVMFLNSSATLVEIQVRLSDAVAAVGQQYIEVGKKSALLSVGVDWIVFPQSRCPSMDAVFTEVDSFLAAETPANRIKDREMR